MQTIKLKRRPLGGREIWKEDCEEDSVTSSSVEEELFREGRKEGGDSEGNATVWKCHNEIVTKNK